MANPVRVQLLGPVRAHGGQGALALRGKTARTVLARLALSAGSVVSADQLAEALWHDDPPSEPSASVRSIVSRLRSKLGREAIVTVGAGYRLDPVVVEVDLVEVETMLEDGQPGECAPEELRRLLLLWDGDALADVAWTAAFEPERARIHELRARLIDAYHESMLMAHRAEETLPDLDRDAASAPLRESTQLLLMRALDACGRTADAVRAGDSYRARLIDQTGLDPSPEYDALALSILTQDPSVNAPARSTAQPVLRGARRTWVPPDTPFVGRDSELEALDELAQLRRLVTVAGPGGVGKTRLVTEFMRRWADGAETNVEMVSLAALEQGSEVDAAVATALGIEVSPSNTLQAVTDRLSNRASTLVLDNCEHVLSTTRMLVEDLLRSVEDLRIITTSRRRLGLPDEAILDVGPLAMSMGNTIDNAPMHLFMDRVERAAPNLSVSDRDRAVAADICRLLDGLPLALELAAVRVPMFGFDGLRQRLLGGLALPGGRTADDDRRQATIEATVAWSLDLLSPEARDVFDELSIFPSWFDLAGLEEVSGTRNPIDGFAEVHDTSLVVRDHDRPAYRLLEPVRQVAQRQIDPDRRHQLVARYAAWVTTIIDRIEQCWIEDDCAAAQQLVIDHRADIRWSLERFIEHGRAERHGRFANVLARTLVERADIELSALCRVEVGPSLEGALARVILAWNQGDLAPAARLVQEIGLEIGSDHDLWGYYNWAQIAVYLYQGDTDRLVEAASIAAADETGYPAMRAESVALWACGLLYAGRGDEAAALMAEKEHILQLSNCKGFVAYTRAEIVAAADPELALDYLATSAREAKEANSTFSQRLTDVSQLVLLIAGGHTEKAARLALRLVPQLTQAGTYPQAWTAMRHIAALLAQLNEPETGLLVLDSANANPSATAVTGEAIRAEEQLRAGLQIQCGDAGALDAPLPLGPLWAKVEQILRARESVLFR